MPNCCYGSTHGPSCEIGDTDGQVIDVGFLAPIDNSKARGDHIASLGPGRNQHHKLQSYSRRARVVETISLTIGYDAPWRQVHALLLLSAARTRGIRSEGAPRVLQARTFRLLFSISSGGTSPRRQNRGRQCRSFTRRFRTHSMSSVLRSCLPTANLSPKGRSLCRKRSGMPAGWLAADF